MRTGVMIILFFILAGIVFLIVQDRNDDSSWEKRIVQYTRTADSLRTKIKEIDRNTIAKDSMMLIYISSLNQTLVELNKETRKNKDTILAHNKRQEEIILEYCRYMERELKQRPVGCR